MRNAFPTLIAFTLVASSATVGAQSAESQGAVPAATASLLPKDFTAVSPAQLDALIQRRLSRAPKVDPFATPEMTAKARQRFELEAFPAETLNVILQPQFGKSDRDGSGCRLDYYPSDERLTFTTVLAQPNTRLGREHPEIRSLLILDSRTEDRGDASGTNRFGAAMSIARFTTKRLAIAVDSPADFVARTSGFVSISPEEARRVVPRLRCVILLSPAVPGRAASSDTRPATFDSPTQVTTDDTAFFGRVHGLWLIDPQARRIFARSQ